MRILITALFLVFTAVAAQAQTSDVRGLYDRIDRLERDIQTLQSQLARGGTSSLVVTSPAAGNGGAGGAARVQSGVSDRLDELEDQLRQLTGKVEESTYHTKQVTTKLERFQADTEMRFKEINDQLHPPQPAAAAAPEPEPAIAAPSAVAGGKKQPTVPNNSAENVGLAPGPQVLGTISDKDLKKGAAAAPAAATAKEIPKDPKAAYDAAYALYQSNDFAESGSAFKAFLAKYPEHQLAPSATYWVGESSYAQKDYKAALVTFAEGYKKFPNSTKAPDLLYKMGQSFAQVGMTKEACSSYKRLFDVHTDMPERLRKAATADKAKLGC